MSSKRKAEYLITELAEEQERRRRIAEEVAYRAGMASFVRTFRPVEERESSEILARAYAAVNAIVSETRQALQSNRIRGGAVGRALFLARRKADVKAAIDYIMLLQSNNPLLRPEYAKRAARAMYREAVHKFEE